MTVSTVLSKAQNMTKIENYYSFFYHNELNYLFLDERIAFDYNIVLPNIKFFLVFLEYFIEH